MSESPPDMYLFGVARLQRHGRVLPVGARKALALLALVTVEGAVSRAHLAAVLWPDLDAHAARRNLRRELFRLRGLGAAPEVLPGPGLGVPAALAVDLQEFRQRAARGDAAGALGMTSPLLLDGLDGAAGSAFDAWLASTRAVVAAERDALRRRLAAELEAAGELAGALAWHRQSLTEDPCEEASALAAMRLHALLGQRAEAAGVFRRLCEALRDNLDLAPARETRALAASLFLEGGDVATCAPTVCPTNARAPPPEALHAPLLPAPAAAGVAAARLPALVPFVGRVHEQRRIATAIGAGRRVYLHGVAGSGKSRLAAECAAARGAWLRVACAPTDTGLAYASATRVLRALREAAPGTVLPEWVRRSLAWLLPDLGEGPPPLAGSEAGERLRAAFAAAWQRLADECFDTIVLDDWHWADEASVDLWRRVQDRAAASIVVYRSALLGPMALARQREEIEQGTAVTVELDGLSADDTLALVHALSQPEGGTLFARRLHQATAGNAFHLVETLRHLAEAGQLHILPDGRWCTPFDDSTADYAELPVPASVREVVLARVRALGDEARRLLEAASLLGDRFEARLLEGVAGPAGEPLVARLEHALAARLLVADGAGLRFAHDLVQACLAASLSPARRQLLHARLARRLQDCSADPALIAAQLEAAGDRPAAIAWRRRAAAAAWRAHALAEAEAHARHALDDGAAGVDAVACHRLLADVERSRGNSAATLAALDAAVHAARDADPGTRLDANLERLRYWVIGGRRTEAMRALEALDGDLAAVGVVRRARALQLRAIVYRTEGRHGEADDLNAAAIALVEAEPGAPLFLSELLDTAARIALSAGRLADCEALAVRAEAAAQSAGDDMALANALLPRGIAALYGRNDRATAAACFERVRALAQHLGHVPQQRAALLNLVKCHTDEGRSDAAAALLDEGEALAPGFEDRQAELAFAEARFYVNYLRGEVDAAHRAAERLLAITEALDVRGVRQASVQLVLDLYLHTGQLAVAERLLATADARRGDALHVVLQAKAAWLRLAQGSPRDAVRRLASLDASTRVEDGLIVAWVGAAAALALDDVEDARQRLAVIDIADEHVVDALAMLLVQRLELARRTGQVDPAARERAKALLPRTPALEAARLRRALD